MYRDIEKMLDDGMTPEKLYQEALRIVEAKNAAAAKVNKEKIAKARGALLTAAGNYVEAVTGKEVSKKFMEDIAKNLFAIEDKAEKKCDHKSEGCKCKKEPTDEEKLIQFMKWLGVF